MKLKLVVASMSILGVVSCSAFADQAVAKTRHIHKNPHKVTRHQTVTTTTTRADYKDMGSLPVQQTVPEACTQSASELLLTSMNQNVGRAMPNACNKDWFKNVQLSGGVNFDGKIGNRTIRYMGENYKRLGLNDIYLNIGAKAGDWVSALASISYNTLDAGNDNGITYSEAYSNNTVNIEQAYLTVANFDVSPIFFQIGKQYQDFSRYEIHPITQSLTQTMSESLATSVKLGFQANGLNASVYAFDTASKRAKDNVDASKLKNTTAFGASLGYGLVNDQMGVNVGVSYLNDLMGVNNIAAKVTQNNVDAGRFGYYSRVGGLALYGDVNSGPFTISARYTGALKRFNVNDLADTQSLAQGEGTKPWTAGIQAGYGYESYGKNQNLYVGYQVSRRASNLGLPKDRWLVGYNVAVFGENTLLGAEWDHDRDYRETAATNGVSKNSNLFTVRAGVKFG
jgi:hypothetical protein